MTIEFYGIPNCDTVKKARKWLDGQEIPYVFHDYKKEGADPEKLRELPEEEEAHINNCDLTFFVLICVRMSFSVEDLPWQHAPPALA